MYLCYVPFAFADYRVTSNPKVFPVEASNNSRLKITLGVVEKGVANVIGTSTYLPGFVSQ